MIKSETEQMTQAELYTHGKHYYNTDLLSEGSREERKQYYYHQVEYPRYTPLHEHQNLFSFTFKNDRFWVVRVDYVAEQGQASQPSDCIVDMVGNFVTRPGQFETIKYKYIARSGLIELTTRFNDVEKKSYLTDIKGGVVGGREVEYLDILEHEKQYPISWISDIGYPLFEKKTPRMVTSIS